MDKKMAVAADGQGELKRVLKLPQLIFFGIAYLSPGCVLMYFGILSGLSGGHFPVVIAITTIAMLLTAISYSKMTRKYPVAGSVYSYVQKTINPSLGFMVGWAIMADYILLPMICYLSFGIYLNVALPQVPIWVWVIISVLIVMILNLRGVTLAITVDTILTIVGIATVLATIAVSVAYVLNGGGTGNLFAGELLYNKETFTIDGVLAAAAIMCVGFLGYDAVSTMAEDTIDPEKNIGRAIITICLGAGILFFITAYVMNAAWPTAYIEIDNPDSAVTKFYEHIGAPFFNVFFIAFNTIGCIAISISGQLAVSRIMYGMGRDGFLPKKVFGYLSPKRNVPTYNILITSAIGLTAIIFANNLSGAISLVSFGALTGFFFVNITVIMQYYVKDKERGGTAIFRYIIMPVIGAAVILYLFINLEPAAKIVGSIWVAVGLIYVLWKTKLFKELPPEMEL